MTYSHQQLAAIQSTAPTLLIRAGAGSGKTHTLCGRLKHLFDHGADPRRSVVVTFTTKAAHELREQLAAMGVSNVFHIGTLHSLAWRHMMSTRGHGNEPRMLTDEQAAEYYKEAVNHLGYAKNPDCSYKRVSEVMAMGFWDMHGPRYTVAKRMRKRMTADNAMTQDWLLGIAAGALGQWLGVLDCLMWDEVQDMSDADLQILVNLSTQSTTLVGDRMQSIYGFRGAHVGVFDFLAGQMEVMDLSDNYRSAANIVAAANRVAADAAVPGLAMKATRAPIRPIECHWFHNPSQESAHIMAWAEERQCTKAILVRHNRMADSLRASLEALGMQCTKPSPTDTAGLEAALELARVMPTDPGVTWDAAVVKSIPHADLGLPHLHALAVPYDRAATMSAVMEALRAAQDGNVAQQVGKCYIGTVHSAKGLEWDHVLIAGCEDDIWPGRKNGEDLEEERRLFYVAVTRARDSLTVTSVARRPNLYGGGVVESAPCRFISCLLA